MVLATVLGVLLNLSESTRAAAARETFADVADSTARVVEVWWDAHLTMQRSLAFDVGGADPDAFRQAVEPTYIDFALLLDSEGRVVATYPERDDLVPGDELAGSFPHIDAVLGGADAGFWATDEAITPSGRVVAVAVPSGRGGGVLTVAFDPTQTSLPQFLAGRVDRVDGARVTLTESATGVEVLAPLGSGRRYESATAEALDGAWQVTVTAPPAGVAALVGDPVNVPGRIAYTMVLTLLALAVWQLPNMRRRITQARDAAAAADLVFDAGATPSMLTDPQGRIVRSNPAMTRATGWTAGELTGRDALTLLLHRDDAEELTKRLEVADDPDQPVGGEFRFRTRGGHDRFGRVTLVPLDATTRSGGVLVQLVDLTDARTAQAELQTSREELRHFSYRVAHDLVGPLAAIKGLAELVGNEAVPEEHRRTAATQLVASAGAAIDLVRGLLVRAERLGGEAAVTLDLRQVHDWLLRMVAGDLAATAGSVDLDSDVRVVEAPEGPLRTILLNLVGNALKYRRRGVPPRIVLSASHDDGILTFTVRDNGRGVPENALETIFERGKRLDVDAQTPTGHGSGLAECRRLVTIAGGRIWAEPGPTQGLVVSFTLPGGPAVDADAAVLDSGARPTSTP